MGAGVEWREPETALAELHRLASFCANLLTH